MSRTFLSLLIFFDKKGKQIKEQITNDYFYLFIRVLLLFNIK